MQGPRYDVRVLAAMVLGAGFGTRLRPITDRSPKTLLPVGDAPLLEHVLRRLATAGATRIVVNTHHRADDVERYATARGGVAVSAEVELLGTAGGLRHARALLGSGAVLVWNGDVLADVDAGALAAAYAAASDVDAILVVRPRPRGQGTVGLDDAGCVVRLRGETFGRETAGGDFAAIHVVGEVLRDALPERGCLVGDVYLPALRRGAVLRTFACDTPFYDVGSPAGYLAANLAWLAARGARSWTAPGARVSSTVRIDETVVGEGAEVRGAGALRRCVVWPGATAEAPAQSAVFTREGAFPLE
jgi:mannose-1-phosphate guanylyltransferase